MSRILFFVVAVLVLFWLLRRALGSRDGHGTPGPDAKTTRDPAGGSPPAADLVACAQCGVNLPVGEAVVSAGEAPRFYCCEAHRRLGPR